MASIRQSIRSSTASKRPTSAIADGQIALNTASGTPGLFFKDSAGNIIKTGPAHYGASAPNSSPAVGGSTGNSIGEAWLDSSLTPAGWKIWNGSAWVNATPLSSDTVQGLVELATNAETQAGADTARAVTSAGLQSKVSDSISTASSSGIASSSAVKTAYDLANAALPKSGGIITGNLEIGSTGSLTFEGSTADGFETTLAVVDPTLDRTITFPNITGTVVTTGDTGTVTSTMILDGTIVDADINASAEIAVSKLADGAARQLLQTDAAGTGVEWASNIDIPGTLDVTSAATFDSTVAVTGALTKSGNNVVTVGDTGTVTSTMILDGTILNADVNASAAIAGTKISPDFGAQTIVTTGVHSAAAGSAAAPSMTFTGDLNTGIYSPGADQVAISTSGTGRITVDGSGNVNIDSNTLYVDAANNRVGVGTGSPGSIFDIQQSTSGGTVLANLQNTSNTASSNARLRIATGGSSGGNPILQLTNGVSYDWYANVDQSDSNKLKIGTSISDSKIVVTTGGNVGVGTTSPSAILHTVSAESGVLGTNIPGNIYIESNTTAAAGVGGGIVFGGAQNGTVTAVAAGIKAAKSNGTAGDYGFDLAFYTRENLGAGAERMRISGVGTTTLTSAASTAPFIAKISSTEVARIDSSGRLLVGTSTSPSLSNGIFCKAVVQGGISTDSGLLGLQKNVAAASIAANDQIGGILVGDNAGGTFAQILVEADANAGSGDYPGRLVFSTTADGTSSPTERMRINNVGDVTFSTNIAAIATASSSGDLGNAAARILGVSRNTTTSRSINANGTINASGTDYAEYMTKAGDFTLAKGGICGVTADGLLTLNYSDAVSFVVKSTNPSYVGGDTWGAGFDDDPEGLEVARQTVDRIAFAGQVPVNFMGATPGQYIVPVETADNGIEGIAKSEADLTLAEYMRAVGKVIAIEDDGRARIIVKVA